MKRRDVLFAGIVPVTVVASGYIGQIVGELPDIGFEAWPDGGADGDGSADDDESNGDDDRLGDGTDPAENRYTVVPRDVDPDSPLEHEVTALQPDVWSPDGPLVLELAVTNRADEAIRYGERRTVLGQYLRDSGFVLLPDSHDRFVFEGGLWTAIDSIAITADYQTDLIDPGESHGNTLVLVRKATVDPPTTVPRELTFDLQFAAEPAADGFPDEAEYEWGFSLVETTDG